MLLGVKAIKKFVTSYEAWQFIAVVNMVHTLPFLTQ